MTDEELLARFHAVMKMEGSFFSFFLSNLQRTQHILTGGREYLSELLRISDASISTKIAPDEQAALLQQQALLNFFQKNPKLM